MLQEDAYETHPPHENFNGCYPVTYRAMDKNRRFSKYQWIEADILRNGRDPRPESYRLVGNIKPLRILDTQYLTTELI